MSIGGYICSSKLEITSSQVSICVLDIFPNKHRLLRICAIHMHPDHVCSIYFINLAFMNFPWNNSNPLKTILEKHRDYIYSQCLNELLVIKNHVNFIQWRITYDRDVLVDRIFNHLRVLFLVRVALRSPEHHLVHLPPFKNVLFLLK